MEALQKNSGKGEAVKKAISMASGDYVTIQDNVLARGQEIIEVPIHYYPRSKAEGKKIGLRDWLTAVRTYRHYGQSSVGKGNARARDRR